jgi:hypothetical protein
MLLLSWDLAPLLISLSPVSQHIDNGYLAFLSLYLSPSPFSLLMELEGVGGFTDSVPCEWRYTTESTLQRTNTENWKQIFPKKELRGHSPNFHIHVSLSDLYIPVIDLPIYSAAGNMWTDPGNI